MQEKGQSSQGTLQLGLVSMTLGGQYSTTAQRSSGSAYTTGLDCSTVSGRDSGNYQLQAVGSYCQGSLSLSNYRYVGQSSGAATLTDRGWTSGANYSHSDAWQEATSLQVTGRFNGAASSGSPWSFSSFVYVTRSSENVSDAVKSSWANSTGSSVATMTALDGDALVQTRVSGGYNINGRVSSYDNPSVATTALLAPSLPVLHPQAVVNELLSGVAVPGQASAVPAARLLGLTLPTTLNALAGAGAGQLNQPPLLSLQAPPLLQGANPGPYGGWLTIRGRVRASVRVPGATSARRASVVERGQHAFQDGLAKFQSSGAGRQSPVDVCDPGVEPADVAIARGSGDQPGLPHAGAELFRCRDGPAEHGDRRSAEPADGPLRLRLDGGPQFAGVQGGSDGRPGDRHPADGEPGGHCRDGAGTSFRRWAGC